MTRYTSLLYTPTISGSSGVATGQVLSASEAIGNTEGGVLHSIQLYNLYNGTRGVTLYLLGGTGTVGAESANFAPSDTIAQTVLSRTVFTSGSYVSLTNSSVSIKGQGDTGVIGLGQWHGNVLTPSTDASIYAAITVNSTGTKFTTGGIKFRFNFKHD